MKPNIHPEYLETTVHCACGAKWQTRSTSKDLHLDICSSCHPFFTGRQKLIDTEGRVDRFTKKFGAQTVEQRKTAGKVLIGLRIRRAHPIRGGTGTRDMIGVSLDCR